MLSGTGGIALGTLNWDSNGNRISGYGVGLTRSGFAAYNSDGTVTFVLSAADGSATFAGSLSAATGTFAGSLSAATGTFAGSLSAATGTFTGSLSAATGTFSGTLTANAINAVQTINIAGNAVTVPTSSFTASEVRNTVMDTFQDAQTITITTSGQRVYISSAANSVTGLGLFGDNDYPIIPVFRLVRDGTELMQSSEAAMSYSETPSAGTYTYRLQGKSTNPFGTTTTYYYAGASNRSLFVIETKR